MKTALLTGITGQMGSYLAELLLTNGYVVHGLARRSARPDDQRRYIAHLPLTIHEGDLTDAASLYQIVQTAQPDEVYHLGAQSHVKVSFQTPVTTGAVTGLGTMRLLEICRQVVPEAKFYFAATSELFGHSPAPQSETTPFHPVSPYSVAKVYGYWATRLYREAYGVFGVNGILFNHESPRRGMDFVSRKIAHGVAEIAKGRATELRLGNLEAKRDWGHAYDYARAIYWMMQYPTPEDWVIGSGETHTVQEFVAKAFAVANLDWEQYVVIDESFKRPAEVNHLQADTTKARTRLGWKPEISFDQLIREMVTSELVS